MKEDFIVLAETRTDTGKGASRRLRLTGSIPGIVYGAHKDPEMIQLDHSKLFHHLEHESFYSHIITLKIGDKDQQVVLKDLQRHPARPFVLHIDFQRISDDEKLKVHIPLHFLNEEDSPGVKAGGIVSHHMTELNVACFPKDLPEYIEIDLGNMDVGDIIHLTELNLPEGVEILALLQGKSHDTAVVSIHNRKTQSDDEDTGEGQEAVEVEESTE